MPFSSTCPRGERTFDRGATRWASGIRSFSSPPVPWRTRRVFPLVPGRNRC